jgi:DNA-binding XRE family transcriptional regulator
MITSEEIINLRKERGWTQKELAKHIGTVWQTVSAWENGKRQPLPIFRDKLIALQKKSQKETQEV